MLYRGEVLVVIRAALIYPPDKGYFWGTARPLYLGSPCCLPRWLYAKDYETGIPSVFAVLAWTNRREKHRVHRDELKEAGERIGEYCRERAGITNPIDWINEDPVAFAHRLRESIANPRK